MSTVQKLQEARELIRQGWCRGSFRKTIGQQEKYCAVGALQKVGNTEILGQPLLRALPKVFISNLSELDKQDLRPVVKFNDSKKNKRDVIKLFDRAIKLAEQDPV